MVCKLKKDNRGGAPKHREGVFVIEKREWAIVRMTDRGKGERERQRVSDSENYRHWVFKAIRSTSLAFRGFSLLSYCTVRSAGNKCEFHAN